MNIELLNIKKDFPLLARSVNGKQLVYLDNAATMQSPQPVIEEMKKFMMQEQANVHRGVHVLSSELTQKFEKSRATVAKFIGAEPEEIVFTRSATESINILARMLENKIGKQDEIAVSILEHHSNYLPWEQLCKRKGAKFVSSDNILLEINKNTKIVACTHVSNVMGSQLPVKDITEKAHEAGALVVVDAAQSIPHMPVNVKEIGCDFLAFSGHKLGAPGIGVLYIRKELLNLEPAVYGGEMVKDVNPIRWNEAPWKFEAGTPNVMGAIALAKAMEYYSQIGMHKITQHEKALAEECRKKLEATGATTYGKSETGIISFNMEGIHPHDMAQLLDSEGIAIRAGHHCAIPLMKHLGINGTCRASFALYNTLEDVDALISAVKNVKEVFA